MKKLILLFIVLILACSKEESVVENVQDNPDLLTGKWRGSSYIHPDGTYHYPGFFEITFNSSNKEIQWRERTLGETTIDTTWVVNYYFDNEKIKISDPSNSKFKGEVVSITQDEMKVSVPFIDNYEVYTRIYDKVE